MLASLEFYYLRRARLTGILLSSLAPTVPCFPPSFLLPYLLSCSLTVTSFGLLSVASTYLSASTTPRMLTDSHPIWQICASVPLPSSYVLADLASCSPRRAIAVPASSAPTFLSPLPVSSIASLSSCSLAADRWPNFQCLYPLSSLHYCSVCYQFHILVNSFDPYSIQPPLLL